jgi:L-asparaginase
VGYQAGVLTAADLLAAIPALQGQALETETVAQLDSCDMDHATWAALAARAAFHLARDEVAGVVVTHGTDTLEESAYFLHRVVVATKPVVFTAAMRPATALSPDGPQNLFDAVTVAREPGVSGVLAVLGGRVFGAADLRKVHGYRVEAFDAGDAGEMGAVEDGRVRNFRPWVQPGVAGTALLALAPTDWPRVDLLTSHAGARGELLEAAVASGARGVVIAGTGNGSVHAGLLQAARRAVAAGVPVWRASRCQLGGVVGAPEDALPSAGTLTPVQARIELMLALVAAA